MNQKASGALGEWKAKTKRLLPGFQLNELLQPIDFGAVLLEKIARLEEEDGRVIRPELMVGLVLEDFVPNGARVEKLVPLLSDFAGQIVLNYAQLSAARAVALALYEFGSAWMGQVGLVAFHAGTISDPTRSLMYFDIDFWQCT